MDAMLEVSALKKRYKSGHEALRGIDLRIERGELFALLGPNGAGKTTLINIICGIVTPSEGRVLVDGLDAQRDYRAARSLIGLVPQELSTDMFETVWATVSFSRRLFGLDPNPAYIEKVLKQLSLWDKRKAKIMTLSGGMKRRVLIAKALAHEPRLLFLDEPTAGVDVTLRKDMWKLVHGLRQGGVTIVLTTHYIEEAEEMADRIGVIQNGKLIVVEDKTTLMKKLGQKELRLALSSPLVRVPEELACFDLDLRAEGQEILYRFDTQAARPGVFELMSSLREHGIDFKDIATKQSSLEDIFVSLVDSHQPSESETPS